MSVVHGMAAVLIIVFIMYSHLQKTSKWPGVGKPALVLFSVNSG